MSLENQVKALKKQVEDLTEVEYGDFKRKVGQYINRFERQNEGQLSADLKNKLENIKTYVVYRPNGDIESTKQRLLQDLN